MDQILQGLKGVQCNQDDMIITGKDDHEHIRAVLFRLHFHGLKANLETCQFLRDEVIFCGIKIYKEGLHKTSDKIAPFVNAPIPNDKSQLRSFMALVNYYHKHKHRKPN
ncbi:Pol polyprotein [Plakobranchus ocellatus]|uniref:Pol polyprotein n=1 Tax=Plakobranchus ocellatus TaxID=259542 RepID=A0AAV4D0I9_9GAST|nr:Pol polyprotein [Plakobranchus ocellatus]